MTVKILYFAELKEVVGTDEEVMECANKSPKEIAQLVVQKHDLAKRLLLNSTLDDLNPNITVAINDNIVNKKDLKKISVLDGDKIAFLLPLSGG